MGTKDIILTPRCFANGNRNGNNICAITRGLDHGGTVTAALWTTTGTTETVLSACTYTELWPPHHQGPQGLWLPLLLFLHSLSETTYTNVRFSLKRKQPVLTIKARKKTSFSVTVEIIQSHASFLSVLVLLIKHSRKSITGIHVTQHLLLTIFPSI